MESSCIIPDFAPFLFCKFPIQILLLFHNVSVFSSRYQVLESLKFYIFQKLDLWGQVVSVFYYIKRKECFSVYIRKIANLEQGFKFPGENHAVCKAVRQSGEKRQEVRGKAGEARRNLDLQAIQIPLVNHTTCRRSKSLLFFFSI